MKIRSAAKWLAWALVGAGLVTALAVLAGNASN